MKRSGILAVVVLLVTVMAVTTEAIAQTEGEPEPSPSESPTGEPEGEQPAPEESPAAEETPTPEPTASIDPSPAPDPTPSPSEETPVPTEAEPTVDPTATPTLTSTNAVEIDPTDPVDQTEILHGDCTASSSTPTKSGGEIRAFGSFNCTASLQHDWVSVEVCLKVINSSGGAWVEVVCTTAGAPDTCCIGATVEMPCLSGTWRYRPVTRGIALNDQGQTAHEDKDAGWGKALTTTCSALEF